MTRVPYHLPLKSGLQLRATSVKLTDYGAEVDYHLPFSNNGLILRPFQVETEPEFHDRDKAPTQEVIVQGKWECMPAALAMCTGHSLFHVKRHMGRAGWRNDNGGAPWHAALHAVRSLGFDAIWLNSVWMYHLKEITNCVVTVPSLNYRGRMHAVSWINGEILDPNMGRPGRKWYGREWSPWTIGATGVEVLLKPMSSIQYHDLQTMIYRGTSSQIAEAIVYHSA